MSESSTIPSPTIDGVAQTVKNYASILQEKHCDVTVVTPNYKR